MIAQIAFPEEIYVGMETEKFLKIAQAKKVRIKLGSFTFDLTEAQRKGLSEMAISLELKQLTESGLICGT